jgi:hypothetical protein
MIFPPSGNAALGLFLSAQSRFLLLPYGTCPVAVLNLLESFFVSPALRLFFCFSTHLFFPLPVLFYLL